MNQAWYACPNPDWLLWVLGRRLKAENLERGLNAWVDDCYKHARHPLIRPETSPMSMDRAGWMASYCRVVAENSDVECVWQATQLRKYFAPKPQTRGRKRP